MAKLFTGQSFTITTGFWWEARPLISSPGKTKQEKKKEKKWQEDVAVVAAQPKKKQRSLMDCGFAQK
eukprot:COSAG06_NODE_4223_length_4454_cov_5.117566_3_plen_67_part_00